MQGFRREFLEYSSKMHSSVGLHLSFPISKLSFDSAIFFRFGKMVKVYFAWRF